MIEGKLIAETFEIDINDYKIRISYGVKDGDYVVTDVSYGNPSLHIPYMTHMNETIINIGDDMDWRILRDKQRLWVEDDTGH